MSKSLLFRGGAQLLHNDKVVLRFNCEIYEVPTTKYRKELIAKTDALLSDLSPYFTPLDNSKPLLNLKLVTKSVTYGVQLVDFDGTVHLGPVS
jgi:hypothetical protein